MDTLQFWKIIEDSRGECGEQTQTLTKSLTMLLPEEIVSFKKTFVELHAKAYRWDLWGAAYLIKGGCSDDGFTYFRAWLIGQGEKIYTHALENPETLADISSGANDDYECEDLLFIADEVYEKKTDVELPRDGIASIDSADEPIGEEWQEDDLPKRFPRLYANFK